MIVVDRDGHERGAECECAQMERHQARADAIIPEFFRNVPRPMDLQPYEKIDKLVPLKFQWDLIHVLQANILGSYSLYGPSGVGKSYVLWSLCKEAIFSNRRVIAVNGRDLVRSMKSAAKMDDTDAPLEALKQDSNGMPTHLFIDELDKITVTQPVLDMLFELFNYAYLNRSQVLVSLTTNLSKSDFSELFGEAIFRRVKEITRPITYYDCVSLTIGDTRYTGKP